MTLRDLKRTVDLIHHALIGTRKDAYAANNSREVKRIESFREANNGVQDGERWGSFY